MEIQRRNGCFSLRTEGSEANFSGEGTSTWKIPTEYLDLLLTQPMANLETLGDYIFSRKNKVQTVISRSFGWVRFRLIFYGLYHDKLPFGRRCLELFQYIFCKSKNRKRIWTKKLRFLSICKHVYKWLAGWNLWNCYVCWIPTPDASHQDYYIGRLGNPNINLRHPGWRVNRIYHFTRIRG